MPKLVLNINKVNLFLKVKLYISEICYISIINIILFQVAAALREMRRVDEEMKKRQKSMQESLTNNEAHQALEDCER